MVDNLVVPCKDCFCEDPIQFEPLLPVIVIAVRLAISGSGHIKLRGIQNKAGPLERVALFCAHVRQTEERDFLKMSGWGFEYLRGYHERVAKTVRRLTATQQTREFDSPLALQRFAVVPQLGRGNTLRACPV